MGHLCYGMKFLPSLPPITAFSLAASLVLRRKGRGKIAFILPFAGPILFVLIMLLESIV